MLSTAIGLLLICWCLTGCFSKAPPKPGYKQSLYWTERSAKNGSVSAQKMLGAMYYLGDGVGKDLKKAYAWYSLAANQGDSTAAKFVNIITTMLPEEELFEAKNLSGTIAKE